MNEFKLPIQYTCHQSVHPSILDSLEFVSSNDVPVYHKVFSPETPEAIDIANTFAKYYTTDTTFLTDSAFIYNTDFDKVVTTDFRAYWKKIKENKEFKLTYQYLESKWVSSLNSSPAFLFSISAYFITSPLLFFMSPLIILLIPFVILRVKNITFKWSEYMSCVKLMMAKHAIGGLWIHFKEADQKQRMYLLGSAAFFLFQFYVNVYTLYTFHKNISFINKVIAETSSYVTTTIHSMNQLQDVIRPLESHRSFYTDIEKHKQTFIGLQHKLVTIRPTLWYCGSTRALFYDLYDKSVLHDAITYSFGFHGYIQCVQTLKRSHKIRPCEFSTTTSFKKAYYPTKRPIKNSYALDKNIIITGPNASGKTTLIKGTMINLLLSQQIGRGFYKSAVIHPYESFYCYINIPDTSGRDSLFQAEARRCKEIIDELDKNIRTFCIFDELFSGTNPEEATASASSFIRYLLKYKDFRFLLTTHFIDMCDSLESTTIAMKQMNTDGINHTYKMIDGISRIKGGIRVLQQMNFPDSIVNGAKCG